MEKEQNNKRSYTIPVMLVIMTLMVLAIVILMSKYLVLQQEERLQDGKRLAEKYEEAALFAQKLQNGADLLLTSSGGREAEGKMLLAQAAAHARHFADLLAEAESREKKIRVSEAREQYAAEMEQLLGKLGAGGEPGQWFSAPDPALLENVRDEAAKMSEALKSFRLPTVDAGFRMMAAGEGWLEPALAAAESWSNLAARLSDG